MVHARFALLLGFVGIVFAAACGGREPTRIVVEVDTDLSVPDAIDRVDVFVRNSAGEMISADTYALGSEAEMPITFALVPSTELGDGPVKIEVLGLFNDEALDVMSTTRVSFVRGKIVPVHVFLSSACRSVRCGDEETCDAGACVPIDRPELDAGLERDAGVDNDASMEIDAGSVTDAASEPDAASLPDAAPEIDAAVEVDAGMACEAGTHMCESSCVSDTSPLTCGTSCTACATDPNGSATCDGASCGIACNDGFAWNGSACARPGITPSNSGVAGAIRRTGIDVLIDDDESFDTTSDCQEDSLLGDCTALSSGTEAPPVCVCYLDSLEVTGSLRLGGARTLMLLVEDDVSISGDIDMSGSCETGLAWMGPGSRSTGTTCDGGGFGTSGGAGGGRSGCGTRGSPDLIPLFAGQGCGGGGVQISANDSIVISGSIDASGGGGYHEPDPDYSSPGGGSGGGVLLEARFVSVHGTISAMGGGGAAGDYYLGNRDELRPGAHGGDASLDAPGGSGPATGWPCYGSDTNRLGGEGSNGFSNGEAGQAAAACIGSAGAGGGTVELHAGHGGGGAGRIRINTESAATLDTDGSTFAPAISTGTVASP